MTDRRTTPTAHFLTINFLATHGSEKTRTPAASSIPAPEETRFLQALHPFPVPVPAGDRPPRGAGSGGGLPLHQRGPAQDQLPHGLPSGHHFQGLCGRRSRHRRVLQGAPHRRPAERGPAHPCQRLRRRRGLPFFQAPGVRSRQHRAGLHQEPGGRHHQAGRQHHHPAGDALLPADARAQLHPQDQGAHFILSDRKGLHQGGNPFSLPEPDLPGPRGLRG